MDPACGAYSAPLTPSWENKSDPSGRGRDRRQRKGRKERDARVRRDRGGERRGREGWKRRLRGRRKEARERKGSNKLLGFKSWICRCFHFIFVYFTLV